MLILRALLFQQRLRYNELLKEIGDISAKELTRNLRAMEEDGLVNRQSASSEQHVVYELTEIALELGPFFEQLGAWGRRYAAALCRTE